MSIIRSGLRSKELDKVEVVTAERIGMETTTYVRNIYKYYAAYRLTLEVREEQRKAREQLAPGKSQLCSTRRPGGIKRSPPRGRLSMTTIDPPPFDGGGLARLRWVRWGVTPTERLPLLFFPSRQGRGR